LEDEGEGEYDDHDNDDGSSICSECARVMVKYILL